MLGANLQRRFEQSLLALMKSKTRFFICCVAENRFKLRVMLLYILYLSYEIGKYINVIDIIYFVLANLPIYNASPFPTI